MFEKIKYLFRKYALLGGNVYCNICERKYLTFLPSGDELKAHSKCPGCSSIDRHRQLYSLTTAFIKEKRSKINLLHIAPQHALATRYIKMPLVNYTAIDKFEKGYKYPDYVKQMDITNLQFDENSFDLLICSHVLEHVVDDTLALQNFMRVLKPGGVGFLVVPYFKHLTETYEDLNANSAETRLLLYGQHDHVRKYGLDFINKLNANGWIAEIIDFSKFYSETECIKLGYLNAEPIFKVTKPNN